MQQQQQQQKQRPNHSEIYDNLIVQPQPSSPNKKPFIYMKQARLLDETDQTEPREYEINEFTNKVDYVSDKKREFKFGIDLSCRKELGILLSIDYIDTDKNFLTSKKKFLFINIKIACICMSPFSLFSLFIVVQSKYFSNFQN
jgi:hypothetical protein